MVVVETKENRCWLRLLRTMVIFSRRLARYPSWADAIATACYTSKIAPSFTVDIYKNSIRAHYRQKTGYLPMAFEQLSSKPGPQSMTSGQSVLRTRSSYAPDVDELDTQQHVQHQPATIADNVPNAMFDENTFENPFATPSTSDADHPLEQVNRRTLSTSFDKEINCDPLVTCALRINVKKGIIWVKASTRALGTMIFVKVSLTNHFFKGTIDPTLFIRRFDDDILVVQVYVDDIIFGSTLEIIKKYGMEAVFPLVPQWRSRQASTLIKMGLQSMLQQNIRSMLGALMYLRLVVDRTLYMLHVYVLRILVELTGISDADMRGYMAPLPPREQRHPFLRYQGFEYSDQDIDNFEERLERIHNKDTHRVQVLDFEGMLELMRDVLYARMLMEHRDDDEVVVFTSQA
ncbi:hypothetical protein Tco_0265175 [Tanacetum coccineum]